jgi:hypothetical protein
MHCRLVLLPELRRIKFYPDRRFICVFYPLSIADVYFFFGGWKDFAVHEKTKTAYTFSMQHPMACMAQATGRDYHCLKQVNAEAIYLTLSP